jgi:hypothetical protein
VTPEELFKLLESIRKKAEPSTQDALVKFEQQLKVYVEERNQEIEAKDREIADLKARLVGAEDVSRASPSDIAKSFRAVIDEFHAEAREADDVGVAIKTLDLEVKGLVEVDEQKTTLVLPSAGAPVDPTALSTFRVSFAAVPAVPAEVAPEPEPPSAPKRSRARPKRS